MNIRSVVLVLAAFTVSISTSHAQDGGADQKWLLATYDANGDRVISVNEVEEKRKQYFSRMDFDLDGDVSFDEYEELDKLKRSPVLKARFDKLDLDQNGRLSDAEYASYLGSFERLDQNGDGNVSHSEMSQKSESNEAKLKQDANMCVLWFCVRSNIR